MVSYAILDGRLHRQDLPGGDWTMLGDDETRALLERLSQPALPSLATVEAAFAIGDYPDESAAAGISAAGDIFHHPVWGDHG